ncbi:sulfatase [Aquisalimonas lutea]|uniref:sulfatase n=1 Tax=Aquisalimonas lutea TaxID=1327750 RepID=UPI0025B604E9|nr:sulfatase [Aquisalimonas lutea]MDN3517037.1 sulfatase [Aquisalimonas lutea]
MTRRGLLHGVLVLAVCNAFFLALEMPRHQGPGPDWLAFEALVLAGVFLLVRSPLLRRLLGAGAGCLLASLGVLAGLDAITRLSLGRPLNVYLDYPLALSVYELAATTLTPAAGVAIVAGLLAALLVIGIGGARLLTGLRPAGGGRGRWPGAALLVIGLAGIASVHAGPWIPHTATPGVTLMVDQVAWGLRTHRESRAFQALLAEDGAVPATRLEALRGVDVIVGFIESYGTAAVFDDRYGPIVRPRLLALGREVDAAGLHMVSGTLRSPVAGGQSWLAHASALSGLWVDNQLRYELLLRRRRDTLVQDFARTGHRTAAIKPAITRAWPEGRWYGFDTILDAEGMDYRGPAFNWVTMPDQFTWWRFHEGVRQASDRPVFGVLSLISSHAPWVPILPVLDDWERLGDGAVFAQWQGAGETPERLWQDPERVRTHFAAAVAYALEVAGGYAARYADADTLLIVLGDHQPAPLITGPDAARTVPVHVISGDPALLAPFRERGFIPGPLPATAEARAGLDALRSWIHDGYAGGQSPRAACGDARCGSKPSTTSSSRRR